MSAETDRGPDFLVIGAQKSGTTTLWEDLRAHSGVAMAEKESSGLLDPHVLTPNGRRRYAGLFPHERGLTGEVCTTYAMLPDHAETAERARALNPDARIIYIVREPLARVISHHHHDYGLGRCGADINLEVRRHPSLVDNTRYGTQLEPWIEAFGREQTLVLRFEDYAADREVGVAEVQDFLGLEREPLVSSEVHNASADKVVATGAWGCISRNSLYRRAVRPLVPELLRRRLLKSVLPPAPERPGAPSVPTLEHLAAVLAPEVTLLSQLTGSPPLWDLDRALRERAPRQ